MGMQRNQRSAERFSVETVGVKWVATDGEPVRPVLRFAFDGSRDSIGQRLLRRLRDDTTSDDMVVSHRRGPTGRRGVLSISDRVTGRYLLEADVKIGLIPEFVNAVSRYADDTGSDRRYRVEIDANDGSVTGFETGLLLLYDEQTLLHESSLVPASVELE